jgi:16S rRNA G966 N2-methylase RsmD
MRVIAGAWKGRPLRAPGGAATRPTSDKVREAVFDVLQSIAGPLTGQHVLDLFAGSGALGIEALSRGAASCTFVERERPALRALHANLAALGVPSERDAGVMVSARTEDDTASAPGASRPSEPSPPLARVAAADVRRALTADARRGRMYTLVFADPPYARYGALEADLVRLLPAVLAPQAVLVLETRQGQALDLPWRPVRVKRYGDTQVAFLPAGVEG